MKEPYVYAKCNFTRSGQPDIWFDVIVRAPKAKLDALRREPKNAGMSYSQLWGTFVGQVVTVLYPAPGASFSIGFTPYPEGEIPAEIQGRPPDAPVSDLVFWTVGRLP